MGGEEEEGKRSLLEFVIVQMSEDAFVRVWLGLL